MARISVLDQIKYVCGYEIPIRGNGTSRKSLLLLYEFEKLPYMYLHQRAASIMESYINDSKFPKCLHKNNAFSSLSTLVDICKNWPTMRKASEDELKNPNFRLRNSLRIDKSTQRAKATILTP